MIQGHGYTSAKIIIVGDGATESDVLSGKALTGDTENKLKNFCKDNQISFNEIYRTLLIKERVNLKEPKVNFRKVTDDYKRILKGEINSIGPNVIVPLSEVSFHYLTGYNGIRKFRGSVLPIRSDLRDQPTRIIPVLGPNPYLYEDPRMEFISRLDFSKVAKNKDRTTPIEEYGRVWIAKTASSLRDFFARHYRKSDFVVFDVETFAGIVTCISFCFDGFESVTAPILDMKVSFDERLLMMHEIAKLLNSPLPKVNQNIKFDWKRLEKLGFRVENVSGDTLIAASCLYTEFPKNLGFLTSLYTDLPYFKDEGKEYDPHIHDRSRLYLYCAKDSLATNIIYREQQKEIVELGVDKVYKQTMGIYSIYKRMEDRGILIDNERKNQLLAKYSCLRDIQQLKLERLINQPINVGSHDQIRELVYNLLGYSKIRGVKTTSKGLPSTDEESLEILMWMGQPKTLQDGPEILRSVINVRKLTKVIEYIVTPLHPDNRMRADFNLAGTETGRSSGSSSDDYGLIFDEKGRIKLAELGRSFQTIAKHGFEIDGQEMGKDLRSMFIPSPGYCFVECDLSQAEARVDTVLASDYDMLVVFDGPIGIHRLTGSWIYNCDPQEIKKGTLVDGVDRYHLAKTARHAGERNMREDRLMMMIDRPIQECRVILNTFHDRQPNIRKVFHRDVANEIKNNRVLIAPNGRRRDFYGRYDDHTVNSGISFLPQAIVADYLKAALRPLFDKHPDALPLSEAHDGFLSEVLIDEKERFALSFKAFVEVPIDFRTCSLRRDFELTIPMEAEWSDTSWQESEMKKLMIM